MRCTGLERVRHNKKTQDRRQESLEATIGPYRYPWMDTHAGDMHVK